MSKFKLLSTFISCLILVFIAAKFTPKDVFACTNCLGAGINVTNSSTGAGIANVAIDVYIDFVYRATEITGADGWTYIDWYGAANYQTTLNTSTLPSGYTLNGGNTANVFIGSCCFGWTFGYTVSPPPTPGSFSINTPSTGCSGANSPYVDLSWTAASNTDYYAIYRNDSSTVLGLTGGTSFRDPTGSNNGHPSPSTNTNYFYAICAYNAYGFSCDSNGWPSITTAACPAATADIKCGPPPGVDGTTTISNNTSTTIQWSSTDATSCSASGAWSGSQGTSGSIGTGNLSGPNTYTYSLSCSNSYSTSSTDSCSVSVIAPTPIPTATPNPTATPIPASPPTVNSLTINNINASSGGTSGRLSTESGSDTNNPINITLSATPGSTSIKQFQADFSPGFSVAYTTTTGALCPGGNYCVNDGGWKNIGTGYGIPNPCFGSSCTIEFFQGSATSTSVTWQVKFHGNFGSKTMTTSGTVTDTNNLSATRTF